MDNGAHGPCAEEAGRDRSRGFSGHLIDVMRGEDLQQGTRLLPVLNPFLRKEQNVFQPGRGTITEILSLRRVIEESRICKSNLVCIFVDFQKAFDFVARDALSLIFRACNVPE